MSPEDRAATSALVRLRREIADDRSAMAKHVAELADARARWKKAPDDHAATVLAAYALHGWYSALEGLCERSVRLLEVEGARLDALRGRLDAALDAFDGFLESAVAT